MDKSVAFLDILGFKSVLENTKHEEAKNYISKFSSVVYSEWKHSNCQNINGFIVSDSIIIYSHYDCNPNTLIELIDFIDKVCKEEFVQNCILIRGAIAKGEFDRMSAIELSTLEKGLIVGQAYVDAYSLESTSKVPGIILSDEVYDDTANILKYCDSIFEEKKKDSKKKGSKSTHIYRYLSSEFLLSTSNLKNFMSMAKASNWLSHYHNAIYYAFQHEKDMNMNQVFDRIFMELSLDNPNKKQKYIDAFIKSVFKDDVSEIYQQRFLQYIRQKLFDSSI